MRHMKQIHFRQSLFTDFYVSFAGRTAGMTGQAFGPLSHQITLCTVFSGSGTFQVQSQAFSIAKGQGLLIPAEMSLSCRPAPGQGWDWARVGFAGERVVQVLSSVGMWDLDNPCFLPRCRFMENPISLLLSDSDSLEQELARQSAACRLLSLLAENIIHEPGDSRRTGQNLYVSKAVEYIIYHYHEPISVQGLSHRLGITRNYLFTLFKEELGCSPRRYLSDFRLKRAAVLLRQTEYSVEDIALSCGYQEPAVFSRAFRRQYGQSPAMYRKHRRADFHTFRT